MLIPRDAAHMRQANPLDLMEQALDEGADLIVFPEGTRSATGRIAPFKPGLFHLTGYYFGTNMHHTYAQPEWMRHLLHFGISA